MDMQQEKRPVTAIALLEADDAGTSGDNRKDGREEGVGGRGSGEETTTTRRRRRRRPATVAGKPGEFDEGGDVDIEALRQVRLDDLRVQTRDLRIEGDLAEEDSERTKAKLLAIHGNNTKIVEAAMTSGVIDPDTEIQGRLHEEEIAEKIRSLALSMGVPDWLGEEDLVTSLKQETVACRVKTLELMAKASARREEAQTALGVVEDAIAKVRQSAATARADVLSNFAALREAVNAREKQLLAAVERSESAKLAVLEEQRESTVETLADIVRISTDAEDAISADDLGYITAYLGKINERVDSAGLMFVNKSAQATDSIPCSFGHPHLLQDIDSHGTVGDMEELAIGGPQGQGTLSWDPARSESKMRVIEDGRAVQHLGPPGKSTSIALTGFSAGRSVWRINPSGLVSGQWVTLGVCTANEINSDRYAQDAVIFSAVLPQPDDDDDNGNSEKQKATTSISKFELSNDDIVVIVLDANQCVVEYYKNKKCIKTAMLLLPGASAEEEDDARRLEEYNRSHGIQSGAVKGDGNGAGDLQKRGSGPKHDKAARQREVIWFPFVSLYEAGQTARFVFT
eukprot:g3641.t1